MPRHIIETIVASSAPLSVYGGVQIDLTVLEQMADTLRSGRIPMLLQHDIRRPLDARVLDAGVRPAGQGYQEVWVRFEVDAEQWDAFDRERVAAGAPGGFSFAASEPLAMLDAMPEAASAEVIHLAAERPPLDR